MRGLRVLSSLGLLSAIAAAGACAQNGSIGAGPGDTTMSGGSATGGATSTTATTTTTPLPEGGPRCSFDADCPAAPLGCSGYTCSSGVCELGPVPDMTPCDDGFFCTVGDTCTAGVCTGLPRACPAKDTCNLGVCDEASQACAFTPGNDGQSCADGNPCDGPGTCASGACVGGGPPTVLFFETFDDNSRGWTLGPEWQIGGAAVSHGQSAGNPDPGTDHTGNPANGVAGVEIGGNAVVASPDPTHPFYYLTSPVIDTSAAAASAYLTFYRWLNSDIAPYMVNTVEASTDGMSWSIVWQSTVTPITDAAWTFQSIDVTAYKGASFQLRFGFDIGGAGVLTVSSWNLDDVKVQTAPCSQ